ncbi:unnamed protein product [Rhizopus stolonifer]
MFSEMDGLPYEIIKNIVLSLDNQDQLRCLTLCKTWYKTVLDIIHVDVAFKKLVYFRQFLHSITHHYKGQLPGINVKTIYLNIDYNSDENLREKRMNFTEFELLARHCPKVTELKFNQSYYWKFLLQLDFCTHWQYLNRIPDIDSGPISRAVILMMGKRLVRYGIDMVGSIHEMSKKTVMEDIQLCGDLRSIKIKSNSTRFRIRDVTDMIKRSKNIEQFELLTKVDKDDTSTDDEQYSREVIAEGLKNLKYLTCLIDVQNHPMLEYIRDHINNLERISFQVKVQRPVGEDGMNLTIAEITRAVILDEILDLFYCPAKRDSQKKAECKLQTKQLRIDVGETSFAFLDNLFTSLVCMTSHLYETYSTTVAIYIDYIQDVDQYVSSYSDTTFHPTHIVRHDFHVKYPFDLEFDGVDVFSKIQRSSQPIVSFIDMVSINLTIKEPILKDAQFHTFDLVLEHFKNVKTLHFTCKNLISTGKHSTERDFYTLDCTADKKNTIHTELKHLTVKGGNMSGLCIAYLFRRCPNLATLSIDRNKYDQHDLLIIDYICLQRNILQKE